MARENHDLLDDVRTVFQEILFAQANAAYRARGNRYECHPGTPCGRCGATPCRCPGMPSFIPGGDVLYQLSRLHAQNVSHMVRMGLSAWDILSSATHRCRKCGGAPCRCDSVCSLCHSDPCGCRTRGICNRCCHYPCLCDEKAEASSSRSRMASTLPLCVAHDSFRFERSAPQTKVVATINVKNTTDTERVVGTQIPTRCLTLSGKLVENLKIEARAYPEKVKPGEVASAWFAFDVKDVTCEDCFVASVELCFDDEPVACTKMTIDLREKTNGQGEQVD